MRKISKLKMFSLLSALLIMLTACGAEESSSESSTTEGSDSSTEPAEELISFKIGINKIGALTNVWAAEQLGIFEEYGLDVELIEFRSGAEAINAQRSGEVHVVNSFPGAAMVANEQGFDLVAVAQNETAKAEGPDSGAIIVQEDSEIQSLSDLAGKKIAVYNLRNQLVIALNNLIEEAGVSPDDVELVEVPFSSMYDTLINNQVDAVSTVDPYTTQILTSGEGRVISWNYVESIPEQPLGAWFARADYVNENEEAISRFNAAISESMEYMLEDEDRAREHIVEFTGIDADLVNEMPMIGWSNNINVDVWQEIVDMFVEAGELEEQLNVEDYIAKIAKNK
ncbi:ABC transporter substrate-binding protein [Alkalihalobacillus sp. MEB130]|uniref:ABC transporter substrate-binding protein n=1 Tax=Alkalihalobacillus sp. MEB130 TaxID=2976704 RepID=UPI0028DDEA5D|nr:ABC transporter substrate-binding protein [Alkalihalobacillus sp. MEB130]MDT8858922.1 ABC transporter substrate-binding protein [Alkalihalobacillus sp. MEB130]